MSISAACRWSAHRRRQAPTRASPRAVFRCSSRAAPSGRPAPKSGTSFLNVASDRLGVGIDALEISDGTISGPGNVRTSYWELADDISLDRDATPGAVAKTSAQRNACRQFRSAGGYSRQGFRAAALHSRHGAARHAAWPRDAAGNLAAQGSSISTEDRARAVAGLVAIVRDGNFAGVVSETEDGAEAALDRACARARRGRRAKRCPMKTVWPNG